ncbi:hypothetical protein GGI21_000427 [Coemansia aciculifera]|uniref:Uncharacterized protein n=1 Tax=Coemansia aciculifera TaxID=417176 RepID=A0ACC1LYU5_9FUNG|nr:hypothetical protein IWW38_004091 [Coemansia aciculifera]KAJ2910875.1 hypothetical protein GGI21_000427 [Coemansia aciculifera]
MKAVSNLRTRMRMAEISNTDNANGSSSNNAQRRRACTATTTTSTATPDTCNSIEASAFLSPPLTGSQLMRRAWTVGPRKLRGLHPSPLILYVRENATLVSQVMDKLYGTLVSSYNIDSKDIRVADVPTVFDVPSAVRRMAKDKQLVVVVGLLARDCAWFDESQVARVRDFLLSWSQQCAVPLIDGVIIADDVAKLAKRISAPVWSVAGSDDIGAIGDMPQSDDLAFEPLDEETGSRAELRTNNNDSSSPGHVFGQYLAHRAVEMFYIEHRGW